MKGLYTVLLLVCSNIFMTFAWYGHLKLQEMKIISNWPLYTVILFSWFIALAEYSCQIPANRIGFIGNESDQQLAAHRCYPDIVGNGFFRVFAPNPRQPYRFSRQWRTVYTCSAESDPGSDYPYHFCHFHDDLFSGRNIKMESPGSGSMSGNGRIFCIYEISLFSGGLDRFIR